MPVSPTGHAQNKSRRGLLTLTWREEEDVREAVIKANQMLLKPRTGHNPDSSDVPTVVGKVQPEQRSACCWGHQVSGRTSPCSLAPLLPAAPCAPHQAPHGCRGMGAGPNHHKDKEENRSIPPRKYCCLPSHASAKPKQGNL